MLFAELFREEEDDDEKSQGLVRKDEDEKMGINRIR